MPSPSPDHPQAQAGGEPRTISLPLWQTASPASRFTDAFNGEKFEVVQGEVQLTIPATWYIAPDTEGNDSIWDADSALAWPSQVMPEHIRGYYSASWSTLYAGLLAALPRMQWAVYNGASVCAIQPYATEAQARLAARLLKGEMELALEANTGADADPDDVAIGIYESLGFARQSMQWSLQRRAPHDLLPG